MAVQLNLGDTKVQSVHNGRKLKLNLASTFEKAIGGDGDDIFLGNAAANVLTGNSGNDVLVGNAGNHRLLGGIGRDILIGGQGLDTILGGGGDDILIAGRTANDSLIGNLATLRAEWASSKGYNTRIANLRAGVGTPAVSLKANVNVRNDNSGADSMNGGGNNDWYFQAIDDVINDLMTGREIVDGLG